MCWKNNQLSSLTSSERTQVEYQQPRRESRILLCNTFCSLTEPMEGIKWQKILTPKPTLLSRAFSLFQLISSGFKLFPIMDYVTFPSTRFTLKISSWQSSYTSLQRKHFGDWWVFWVPLFLYSLTHKSCINKHTTQPENTTTLFNMCSNYPSGKKWKFKFSAAQDYRSPHLPKCFHTSSIH